MEYLTCISIPTPDVEFYGRAVGDMVRKGARVQADGKVKGHFPYVTNYITINGKTEGHYFPAWVNIPGKSCEIVRCSDGTSATGTMGEEPGDNFVVILMDDNKEFDIKVDGKKICHLDFSEAILEEKREEKKMNVSFFDTGICGVPITGHVGSVNKDSKAEQSAAVFEAAMPVGTRLVNVIAVASEDMAGATKVTVGDGNTENAYANELEVTAGQAAVEEGSYKAVSSGTVKVKVDAEITAGSVDIFATVLRLEV